MSKVGNHLIDLLPGEDQRRLIAACDSCELTPGKALCEPGHPTPYVYFPVEGIISLVSLRDRDPDLEVGMVGREGMLGAQVALGVETAPLRAQVQVHGVAWRIGTADFLVELAHSARLQHVVNRYLYVLMAQMAASSACPRFHAISARLPRWLLMSQDRTHSDRLFLTQESLAYRLGVRRGSITAVAGELLRNGLIAYNRGNLTVLDRPGLETVACGCYAADRQTYSALL